jgi:hypothetical protein
LDTSTDIHKAVTACRFSPTGAPEVFNMKTVIYWFSGTGNSYRVADILKDAL